jgi:dTDP-4-amino-4,6-dideoxygalactose transaminase
MIAKVLRYVYQVPFDVPAWGWGEFRATGRCLLGLAVVEGPCAALAAAAIRDFLDVTYALPVNRGRTAIELALRALGVGAGDEVVLPSYLCRSVLDPVVGVGAGAAFADVGPDLNVTVEAVRSAITPRTKCVIVPHLFGKAAPIDRIETMLQGTGIALIDDAAQAFGTRCSGRLVGTFGAFGIVGCGPGKPLDGAAGGLLVTQFRTLYERAAAVPLGREKAAAVAGRALSRWAWHRFRGLTLPLRVALDRLLGQQDGPAHSRCAMSNLDGAILLEQLRKWERNSRRRRRNAAILGPILRGKSLDVIENTAEEVITDKLILVLPSAGPRSGDAIAWLARAGIEAGASYAPLHLQQQGEEDVSLPMTEALWDRIVWVPVEVEARGTTLRKLEGLGGRRVAAEFPRGDAGAGACGAVPRSRAAWQEVRS